MFLRCPCGYTLTSVAGPGCIEHHILTDRAKERLQDAVDREVTEDGVVDLWPEHFEAAGEISMWVCPKCLRLFIGVYGSAENIVIYRRESVGLPSSAKGFDSELGTEDQLLAIGREQAGPSPLAETDLNRPSA